MTGELEVGTCRYCGATRFIEADGIIDADVYATYKCVCGDAKKARLRALLRIQAEAVCAGGDKMEKLTAETTDAITALAETLAGSDVHSATIALTDGTQIKMRLNNDERHVVRRRTLERVSEKEVMPDDLIKIMSRHVGESSNRGATS